VPELPELALDQPRRPELGPPGLRVPVEIPPPRAEGIGVLAHGPGDRGQAHRGRAAGV
jgi:hypothetical protein